MKLDEMRLDCVILNYQDADTAVRLIRQIEGFRVIHRIVAVDNGSRDDSRQKLKALEEELPRVKALLLDKNGGYGAGNNAGVRWAVEEDQATHVVIANPDVSFSEDCLRRLLSMFQRRQEVAAAAASMKDGQYRAQRNGWPLRGYAGELLSMGPVSRRLFRRFLEYPDWYFKGKRAAYVDAVHGSMLMVDAERFLQCGGYDEGIFLYQEEAVLARRLKAAGFRTVLLEDCSYRHDHSVSISRSYKSSLARQRLREESELYYMRHYLFAGPGKELFARLWFWGIRMEIRAAGLFAGLTGSGD
ncbi:MAG: glycosyltransferase [Eubacteriales bacterium]|nr:glycosyltransferase [Eubacteriales bacterium]